MIPMRYLVALLVLGAATFPSAGEQFCTSPRESFPENPFRLEITVSTSTVAMGDRLDVKYVLHNESESAVAACPEGWDNHLFMGPELKGLGLMHRFKDGFPTSQVIRMPARTSLMWTRSIKVPDVGTGEVKLTGKFSSWPHCWLWKGSLQSEPVVLKVIPQSGAGLE